MQKGTWHRARSPPCYRSSCCRCGRNAPLQAGIAAHYANDYAFALALVAGVVAIVIVVLTAVGVEAKGVAFGSAAELDAGGSVRVA